MMGQRIHVGVIVAHSPEEDPETLRAFVTDTLDLVQPAIEEATAVGWSFHAEQPIRLTDDRPRPASDVLQEASLRMVDGPYDAILVVTDTAIVSRAEKMVPGLASAPARVMHISTRRLRVSGRGEPLRPMDSPTVRRNAAALVLHLLGHLFGLRHGTTDDGVMAPFAFDPDRPALPAFSDDDRRRLQTLAPRFPDRHEVDEGIVSDLAFHLTSALRNGSQVLLPVVRSRAPLLPLSLPRLATAALAPAIILVFTAEIWDAGFHMTNSEIWTFAAFSVVASAGYLLMAQRLFLPQKEKRYNSEHLAVVNVAMTLTVLVAAAWLFTMLLILMLGVQMFIFPPDLVREWPSLDLGPADIGFTDQLRIAALISAIGVLTGALGGGLESRDVVRHLALFEAEP
jgi:predicted Zn-dependent protease